MAPPPPDSPPPSAKQRNTRPCAARAGVFLFSLSDVHGAVQGLRYAYPWACFSASSYTPAGTAVTPGKMCIRDSHSPIFHQIEGLVVDKGITFSDLKGTLEMFIQKL